jgi:preprotein translocase subunit Sss1
MERRKMSIGIIVIGVITFLIALYLFYAIMEAEKL